MSSEGRNETQIFIFLVMGSQGIATSVGIEAFLGVIIVVSLVLSMLSIREVK